MKKDEKSRFHWNLWSVSHPVIRRFPHPVIRPENRFQRLALNVMGELDATTACCLQGGVVHHLEMLDIWRQMLGLDMYFNYIDIYIYI